MSKSLAGPKSHFGGGFSGRPTESIQNTKSTGKTPRGHPLLDDAAVQAVRQWKYSPTLLNGEPVPVVGTVTVVFSLR